MSDVTPLPEAPTPVRDLLAGLSPEIGDDLAVAIGAVLAGGRAVLPHYERDDLGVEDGGRGPVTAADRASHQAIMACLDAFRPGEAVLSEESGDAFAGREGVDRLWVVDPLDGTREFIDRIDEFSVMAGLAEAGRAVLGAVFRPGRGRLYAGAVGHGAWRVDLDGPRPTPMDLGPTGGRTDAIRLVRSRSHPDERLARLEEALEGAEVVLSGSAGTKCCLVAEGEADLYVHPVPFLKEWDTCAPEAVLRAAGGRVTDCGGDALRYGKADPHQPRGIFAAAPATYDRVEGVVAGITADLQDSHPD